MLLPTLQMCVMQKWCNRRKHASLNEDEVLCYSTKKAHFYSVHSPPIDKLMCADGMSVLPYFLADEITNVSGRVNE